MCGRYTLRSDLKRLARLFQVEEVRLPLFDPRYNVAPSQDVLAVREIDGRRELVELKWGLVPRWSKDPTIGYRMINARSETVAEKPSFRSAFKSRRCLIPADGFYEWKKTGAKTRQPYFIHLNDDQPFAFAGLWEYWQGDGEVIESCALCTTEANELMRPLHDRMPVILPAESYAQWLDPDNQATEALANLLEPFPAQAMAAHPVSTYVNKPANQGPECVQPIENEARHD
jgi:putative SOS response-associated peptidase YedK